MKEPAKENPEEIKEPERQAHYSNPLKFGKGGPDRKSVV